MNVVYCTNRDSSPQDLNKVTLCTIQAPYHIVAKLSSWFMLPRRCAASVTAGTPRYPVHRRERAESDIVLATLKQIFKPLLKGKTFFRYALHKANKIENFAKMFKSHSLNILVNQLYHLLDLVFIFLLVNVHPF